MADPDVPVGTTDDLASLGRLDESILLNELKHRYNHDKIYVSVNYSATVIVVIVLVFQNKPHITCTNLLFLYCYFHS